MNQKLGWHPAILSDKPSNDHKAEDLSRSGLSDTAVIPALTAPTASWVGESGGPPLSVPPPCLGSLTSTGEVSS